MFETLPYYGAIIGILLLIVRTFYEYAFVKPQPRHKLEFMRYGFSLFLLLSAPFATAFFDMLFRSFFGIDKLQALSYLEDILYRLKDIVRTTYLISGELAFQSGEIHSFPSIDWGQLVLGFVFCWVNPNLCTLLGTPVYFVQFSPKAHLMNYASYYATLSNIAAITYQIAQAMIYIVNLFTSDFILDLLPIGVFFRFLPGMKKIGNVLIAISLGLYVMFPYFLSFFLSFYPSVRTAVLNGNWVRSQYLPSTELFLELGVLQVFIVLLPNAVLAVVVTFISQSTKALELVIL